MKKAGIIVVVIGVIMLAGSTTFYTNPTLGHKASLAVSRPEKQMTAEVQSSSESEVPVIVKVADPLVSRKPGAMAVSSQRQRVLSIVQPLSVAYNFSLKDVHPVFGLASGTVPLNNKQALYQDRRVQKIAKDRVVRIPDLELSSTSSATTYLSQEEVSMEIDLENLWGEEGKGEGVSVAYLDSGASQYVDVTEAWSIGGFPAQDEFGHGTAVSGIIKETAPKADVYSIRVLDEMGIGRSSDIIKGIEKVVENVSRPVVVNMSLGTGKSTWNPLESACEMASSYQGITIVAASGNTGADVMSPATSSATVAVGALNADGELAEYSSRGEEQTVVSYGDVMVQWLGSERTGGGTSFASPRVAGMVACKLSGKEVGNIAEDSLLKKSSRDLGEPGKDPKYGYGLTAGNLMSTAPVEEEKPLGGRYPIFAVASLAVVGIGVVITQKEVSFTGWS